MDEAAVFAPELASARVDLLDVISGAREAGAGGPENQGMNLGFARRLKNASGLHVTPIGEISEPESVAQFLSRVMSTGL